MRNFGITLCLSLLCILNAASAQTTSREDYLKAFEQRVRYVTAAYDTASGGYPAVASRYAHNVEIARADSMFVAALKEPRGDMFWMFPVIGAYMHGKDKMSPETKAAVRNAWKTYAPYRGDTENHWAMYHASLYIAAEQWPNLPGTEWFNGKSSEENLVDAREYLMHWLKITTTIGQGEFDSPDYFPEYVTASTLLAEFAKDPAVRVRGEMLLEYILADFGVEHLDGQYTGGFSRIYQPAVFMPLKTGAAAFAYLYFGTGAPSTSSWLVLPALSKFRLPQIIYNIATDRSKPYIERERKRVRNVIRFGTEKNPPVYKYTYMTKDYAIGSLQGGLLQPIQQHTWGINYLYGRPYTTIFGLHPYWSSYELGMFFPEELKPLIADVVASKGTYNNPDKWTGGSPFERTFQVKNTLIALYDIKPGTMTEHIDGFFPRNLEERIVDKSGWIICKAGDTFIGWYPLQEYEWIEEKDVQGVTKPGVGVPEDIPKYKETGNWRLRSHHLQNGYVVEVRSKDEAGSFERFAGQLRKHLPKATLKPGTVSVQYRTLNDDDVQFGFPDKRILNGKEVDLSQARLFEGPFLNADVGSQKLSMSYKNQHRTLDFIEGRITNE
jgi:hypothetical protein